MKIAFIIPSLANKGPIIVVYNLIKILNKKAELIDVYYFDEVESPLNFDCKVHRIDSRQTINFDMYDIIHSHTIRADYFVFKSKKNILSAKIVSTLHQDTIQSFKTKYNYFASFFLSHFWCYIHRQFDGIIAISESLNHRYSSLLSNKITTIHNGCFIEKKVIDPKFESIFQSFKDKGYKILCSYATITKDKGLSQVILSLKKLHEFGYIIIGDGPYISKLIKLVNEQNLSERVKFLPYTNTPYSYLKFVDVYMMPSYSEGFGLAMVEAALEKKSIVCSDIKSFHEIFSEKEVSFFKLNDSISLINATINAYSERSIKGELAYMKANLYFTSEVMAEKHVRYYNNLLNK